MSQNKLRFQGLNFNMLESFLNLQFMYNDSPYLLAEGWRSMDSQAASDERDSLGFKNIGKREQKLHWSRWLCYPCFDESGMEGIC
jgi:hypothetical protein